MLAATTADDEYFHGERGLVPEVPDAGKHHRHAVLVGGSDDLRIAQRTAGLDYRRNAVFGGKVDAVAERKEGIWMPSSAPLMSSFASAAFMAARRLETTRLICPAPDPQRSCLRVA